jgi:hypothetical protein
MLKPSTAISATVPAPLTLIVEVVVLRSRMSLGRSVAASVTVQAEPWTGVCVGVPVEVGIAVRVAVLVLAAMLVLVAVPVLAGMLVWVAVPAGVAVLPPACEVGVLVRVGGSVGSVPVAVGGTGIGVRVGRGPVL